MVKVAIEIMLIDGKLQRLAASATSPPRRGLGGVQPGRRGPADGHAAGQRSASRGTRPRSPRSPSSVACPGCWWTCRPALSPTRLDRRADDDPGQLRPGAGAGALTAVVAAGHQELWMLYVAAFALGVGETLFDTAAQSILPNVVDDHTSLERANSRLYAVGADGQPVRRPGARRRRGRGRAARRRRQHCGLPRRGRRADVITGAFRAAPASDVPTTIRRDLVDGVRYLVHHRLLRALALCVGISNLASMSMFSVFRCTPWRRDRWASTPRGSASCSPAWPPARWSGRSSPADGSPPGSAHGRPRAAMAVAPVMYVSPALTANPWVIAVAFFVSLPSRSAGTS